MTGPVTFYHNPNCSKSRETKKILDDAGVTYTLVKYIETPPDLATLHEIADALDVPVGDMLRPKEAEAEGWNGDTDDADAVLKFLAAHPRALQRPIVMRGATAVIGRPTTKVSHMLGIVDETA